MMSPATKPKKFASEEAKADFVRELIEDVITAATDFGMNQLTGADEHADVRLNTASDKLYHFVGLLAKGEV